MARAQSIVVQPLNGAKRQPPVNVEKQPPAGKRRPQNGSQDKGQPPRASQCQEQPLAAEIQPPDLRMPAPDLPPDPDPKSSVSKEDWGKGSIDPG